MRLQASVKSLQRSELGALVPWGWVPDRGASWEAYAGVSYVVQTKELLETP